MCVCIAAFLPFECNGSVDQLDTLSHAAIQTSPYNIAVGRLDFWKHHYFLSFNLSAQRSMFASDQTRLLLADCLIIDFQ